MSALLQREANRWTPEVAPTKSARVEVRGLYKAFGTNLVLKGIDLDLQPGEFVAIVGRSGCGKSTLLRVIAGLEKQTRGEVLVDGEPLRAINTHARVMFQDARLFPWKRVRENVGVGIKKDWKERADVALEDVGLLDRSKDWPSILSGGQRQRVALARALASQPPILLLDEPLGALDALTRIEMQGLVERVWQEHGFTALLITHDVEEAVALADRVVVIDQGRISLNIPVPFPRPRDRANAEFIAAREEVLRKVKAG